MTEAKKVAASITNMLKIPVVKSILDRGKSLPWVAKEIDEWWNYDLLNRKPTSAIDENEVFRGTDLDLACFLYALVGRKAVINIPVYKGHTKKKMKESQDVISEYNRHGELLGLVPNKYFFSFNIKINDLNVIENDKVGAPRTFSLTDKTGKWYDGWQKIDFVPSRNENKFITENKLWTGNSIIFKNFIHPNRWTSFFGHKYIITKMLIERLEDYCAFLNTEVKRLLQAGIKFPKGDGPKSETYEYGASKQAKFTAFETKIYIPKTQISNDYRMLDMTQKELVSAYNIRSVYMYGVIPKLRFMTRATEYAHYTQPNYMPAWLKNVKWEQGFSEPGKRIKWERLKLFQSKVGEQSISILKRTYEKSVTVSDN